jgi:sec-independent protein translocase protein TatC
MSQSRDDDLFRESTMTFGQHLAELRTCLVKSALGLAAGFVIGLMVGGYVVQFIQQPLSRALKKYVQEESLQLMQGELEKMKESGESVPWTSDEITHRVEKEQLLANEVYVDSNELLQELKKVYPTQFKGVQTAPHAEQGGTNDKERLIRLFLLHRSEDDPRLRSKSMGTTEPFTVYVKASLLVGVLLASPWIFYQIWNFVAAGLYPHERRYIHLYLPFSIGLFLLGASLAFFVVFEPVLKFLLSFNRHLGIEPELRINEWLGFVLLLPVGFGIGFQLPLVMLFLERIGMFSVRVYASQWRIAVLVIFVVAAVLTPPDPSSMLLLAGSLTFLYFGGILLCKMMPQRPRPFGNAGRSP